MYAISPDGQEVAYTSNIDEVEATSTNNEIFVVPMSGGTAKKISTSPGADTTPLYSPDGKYLAWRSQARAGFEADKWRLLVQDRQSAKTRDLTEKFDRSSAALLGRRFVEFICFSGGRSGGASISCMSTMDTSRKDRVTQKTRRLHADDLALRTRDIGCFFTFMSIDAPNEICDLDIPGIRKTRRRTAESRT